MSKLLRPLQEFYFSTPFYDWRLRKFVSKEMKKMRGWRWEFPTLLWKTWQRKFQIRKFHERQHTDTKVSRYSTRILWEKNTLKIIKLQLILEREKQKALRALWNEHQLCNEYININAYWTNRWIMILFKGYLNSSWL